MSESREFYEEKAKELLADPTVLDSVVGFIQRFIALEDAQADTLALWTAHTHVVGSFDATPYLAVTSAEKRSGKTRLLEVLELLAHEPLSTANISDASLFRAIDHHCPTVLMDEADAIFKARDREELRGLLNAGYRRGATAQRMGGKNNTELQTFNVYCPKVFAGIGDCLPDTITDRAVPIRLKRRTREEEVERFRHRLVRDEGHKIRDRLTDWLQPQEDELARSWPELPEKLDDRAQDVWEPMLAIADLAGGDWPARARRAALSLSTGEEREDDSLTFALLRDIQAFFLSDGRERVKTADLLNFLHKLEESPWADWRGGKPLTAHALSSLLKPYRIKTVPVWVDGKTTRGYKVEQFADPFARILGVSGVSGVRDGLKSGAEPNAPNAPNAGITTGGPEGPQPMVLSPGQVNDHGTEEDTGLPAGEQAVLAEIAELAREGVLADVTPRCKVCSARVGRAQHSSRAGGVFCSPVCWQSQRNVDDADLVLGLA